MGTRINVLLDHRVPNHWDRPALLEWLAGTLPTTLAVRDYWLAVDPDSTGNVDLKWTADPPPPRQLRNVKNLNFTGPGCLFLSLTTVAARIHTGGRWRGFLSIDPLLHVHLAAFRSIARALESTKLVYFADNDVVDGLFLEGKNQDECVALLEQSWGPHQASIESIDPKIVQATEHGVPTIWYVERIVGAS
jgi:hypothetical protein